MRQSGDAAGIMLTRRRRRCGATSSTLSRQATHWYWRERVLTRNHDILTDRTHMPRHRWWAGGCGTGRITTPRCCQNGSNTATRACITTHETVKHDLSRLNHASCQIHIQNEGSDQLNGKCGRVLNPFRRRCTAYLSHPKRTHGLSQQEGS